MPESAVEPHSWGFSPRRLSLAKAVHSEKPRKRGYDVFVDFR
jgi:hypothetical protein